jgi:hypothetical protein
MVVKMILLVVMASSVMAVVVVPVVVVVVNGDDGSGNRVRSMVRSCITRSKDRLDPKKKKRLRAKYCRMGVRKISRTFDYLSFKEEKPMIMEEMHVKEAIMLVYVARRQYHVAHLIWD